jgi:hypothetical protein
VRKNGLIGFSRDRRTRMAQSYGGFDIESFEAGRNLWHARIRRADAAPVVIDGVIFPVLELGVAWSDPESAVADAITHIDQFGRRYAAAPTPPADRRATA